MKNIKEEIKQECLSKTFDESLNYIWQTAQFYADQEWMIWMRLSYVDLMKEGWYRGGVIRFYTDFVRSMSDEKYEEFKEQSEKLLKGK